MAVSIEVYDSAENLVGVDSTASTTHIVPISANLALYDTATGIVTGVPTTVVTYLVPALGTFYIKHVAVSGTNVATYWLDVDGVTMVRRRTNWTNLNDDFNMETDVNTGLKVSAGSLIEVKVVHARAAAGDFDGTIFGRLEGV